jgi:putative MATE family efflux protein
MNDTGNNRLDEFLDNPKRAVWTLAWPMMTGSLVHALYGIIDTLFIGRIGPLALAAATFVSSLFFVVISLNIGFVTGVTACIARAFGSRDQELASRLASGALGLGICIGLFLTALALATGPGLIPVLGAEGEVVDLAWQYVYVLSFGMPFIFVSGTIRAAMTGEGNAKTPMMIMIIAALINVILDPIFIFVLDMGIMGAALATDAAIAFTFLAFLYIGVVKKKMIVRFRLSQIVPRWILVGPIVRIGGPAATGQLVMALGSGLRNRVLSVFGQTAVAGVGAGSKVDLLVAMPILGLAGAALSVIGMFVGAGRIDLVRSTALYVYRWNLIISVCLGVAAFSASGWIIGLFTTDAHSLAEGRTYLKYMVFAYPLMAFGITTGRILFGVGQGAAPLAITFLRVLLIAIPGAYIAVYLFDAPVDWIWITSILGGVVGNIVAFWWIRRSIWGSDSPALVTRS